MQVLSSSWDGRPFGHIWHGPKIGGCSPLEEGRWVPHLTQCGQGRRRKLGAVSLWGGGAGSPSNTLWPRPKPTSLPSDILIHPVAWPQQTWAKNWGCRFGGTGAGSPSNTMRPGPRPISLPSDILFDPAVSRQTAWAKNWGVPLWGRGSWVPI